MGVCGTLAALRSG